MPLFVYLSFQILDEATASIDNETDNMIQEMIRASFKNSTVLTIAHRLHTIIDSDKIIVMDSGKVAEMDTPDKLLQMNGGIFKALWENNKGSHGGAMKKSKSGTWY